MRYAMLIKPTANVRYQQSLQKLALIELECQLKAWGIDSIPEIMNIQDEPFITFETDEMTEKAWDEISRHSSVCFTAEIQGDLLMPLKRNHRYYVTEDLPQVLKYKGKTNADFTLMMLHCAKAASAFARETEPLCVLDPLCGKATTLFCALQEGNHAMGVELDTKAIAETDTYFSRFLKMHYWKHKREMNALTIPHGKSARVISYTLAQNADEMRQGNTRSLSLINGDATKLDQLVKKERVDLIVSDLPYGVQHAPKEGRGISSLQKLINDLATGCHKVLRKGGAIALSFNTHTLRRTHVIEALQNAGFEVMEDQPYNDFSHWVEQAVQRDVVIARK